jgi:hypothetical protein
MRFEESGLMKAMTNIRIECASWNWKNTFPGMVMVSILVPRLGSLKCIMLTENNTAVWPRSVK